MDSGREESIQDSSEASAFTTCGSDDKESACNSGD